MKPSKISIAVCLLGLITFQSSAFAQTEKSQAALAPIAAVGEISEAEKKIVFIRLENHLSKRFQLISQREFEKAQSEAYQTLEVEQCTEEQCIRKIQELLQVERLFILQLVRDKGFTQLSLSLITLDDKQVVEDLCKACDIEELYQNVEALVTKLIGKSSQSAPETSISENEKEQQIWNMMKNSQNADDFYKFIQKFPEGHNAPEAQKKLAELENSLWESISVTEIPADFEQYVKIYPKGKHAEEATRRKIQIEMEEKHRIRYFYPVSAGYVNGSLGKFRNYKNVNVEYVFPYKLWIGNIGLGWTSREFDSSASPKGIGYVPLHTIYNTVNISYNIHLPGNLIFAPAILLPPANTVKKDLKGVENPSSYDDIAVENYANSDLFGAITLAYRISQVEVLISYHQLDGELGIASGSRQQGNKVNSTLNTNVDEWYLGLGVLF